MKARTIKKQKVRAARRARILDKREQGRHGWWWFLSNQEIGKTLRGYHYSE